MTGEERPHLRPARRRRAAAPDPPAPAPASAWAADPQVEELRELLEATVDHLVALRAEVTALRQTIEAGPPPATEAASAKTSSPARKARAARRVQPDAGG